MPQSSDVLIEQPVTVCIIGAGNRGSVYARFALKNPRFMRVVAVASPTEFRRFNLAKRHNIPTGNAFSCWKELTRLPQIADAVIITNLDSMYFEAALAFIERGYHLMLENPTSLDLVECAKLVNAASRYNVIFMVGHPERHNAYNRTMKRFIDSGAIGEVMNIQHMEPIGFYHFRPSFRRNGTKKRRNSWSLMAKNIHDMDLISWFMGTKCRRVSSFGNLYRLYKSKNFQVKGSLRCHQCPHKQECCYTAQQRYLDSPSWVEKSPITGPVDEVESLASSYSSRNDAFSDNETGTGDSWNNQVINMEFDDGKTCNFTMMVFTESMCERKTRIFGTLGELEADGHVIRHFDFLTRRIEKIRPERDDEHDDEIVNSGDYGVNRFFLECVTLLEAQGRVFYGSQDVLENQLHVLAAEQALNTGTVINIDDFRRDSIGDMEEFMDIV